MLARYILNEEWGSQGRVYRLFWHNFYDFKSLQYVRILKLVNSKTQAIPYRDRCLNPRCLMLPNRDSFKRFFCLFSRCRWSNSVLRAVKYTSECWESLHIACILLRFLSKIPKSMSLLACHHLDMQPRHRLLWGWSIWQQLGKFLRLAKQKTSHHHHKHTHTHTHTAQ